MNKSKIKTYVISLAVSLGVGGLSAALTYGAMEDYERVIKPVLTPPGVVFPIVWSVLFVLMAVSAAGVWLSPPTRARSKGLIFYAVSLIFNFFWSILFFNLQAFGVAFFWLVILWGLILLMISFFYKSSKTAGLLQIPYLLWVSFAGYLNYMIWMLN